MSKGSNRRPGTGYGDGWDRVFGNLEDSPGWGDAVSIDDPETATAKNIAARERLDSMPVAQPYGTIRPLIVGTCKNCMHWSEANQPVGFGSCDNEQIRGFHEPSDGMIWLRPPASFGCSLWEKKV